MPSTLSSRDSRSVPEMHQRSLRHDYHGRGIYLVTLCTEGRRPLLGSLVGSSLADAAIEPTALGREVLHCWEQIPAIQRELAAKKSSQTGQPCVRDISLLERQLMPDHFHGILFVRKEMDIALGDVIRGFMVGCTKAFNGLSPQVPQLASPQICGAPNQGIAGCSKAPGEGTVGCGAYSRREGSPLLPLWEKGYHDRLLTHEGQLQNMIDYVRDNPRRLMLRRQHRDLFIVQRNVCYLQWRFSAIGRVQLLDAPLVAVHVRRYFNEEQRRNYMNSCILAARRGAVLVSPFISEHEKRVRDEAFREGLFCIQLCAEPFSDYHKPPGELIEPCSNGHLLLLTLATGTPQERRITRDECSSLNAVAESMARQSLDNNITS
ncbi:MAG: hypothetical protein J5552_07250 [Prevotella sp.]|nr:hypothetical protein [Prevotella sp.]